jgi:hypothetical protein
MQASRNIKQHSSTSPRNAAQQCPLAAALALALAAALACLPHSAHAFNFDDLEKVEKVERGERKVREAKAEAARREEEARRQAQQQADDAARQRAASSGGSSGGGSPGSVYVEVEMVCGLAACSTTQISISGPGNVNNLRTSAFITSNTIGTYRYSASFSGKYGACSGSFRLSGAKSNIKVKVYQDCRDAGTFEY